MFTCVSVTFLYCDLSSQRLLAVEGAAADAEQSRGSALVAAGHLQDRADVSLFQGSEVRHFGGFRPRRGLELPGSPQREPLEILPPDHSAAAKRGRSLQQVLELPDVACEVVREQGRERVAVDRRNFTPLPRTTSQATSGSSR